ncbi:hypothetical protein BO94DRAFT_357262 [Aspergillus sclerotioniger CBS 115572]|uniref:Uncharacterized protein n=1 Tax=Aspergillus sclerotioniger CBS 115572 TaxID=1450535 RepID=A0A317X446_9EURO|nr:hypothetical protein BO94DRAFT_357262 [Aspergillus sclerotioniger CBS 115572]PWY92961.1 hypothetical protein BO94DRAFT_357262 [Aspergillus sclerotioniger CBS 115572]
MYRGPYLSPNARSLRRMGTETGRPCVSLVAALVAARLGPPMTLPPVSLHWPPVGPIDYFDGVDSLQLSRHLSSPARLAGWPDPPPKLTYLVHPPQCSQLSTSGSLFIYPWTHAYIIPGYSC